MTWVCLPAWSRASCDRSEPRRPVCLAGPWRTKCPVQRLAQRRCSIKKTTMKKNRNQPGQKKSEGTSLFNFKLLKNNKIRDPEYL